MGLNEMLVCWPPELRDRSQPLDRSKTMIDWDSDDWGGTVHYASDGSWVTGKHDEDSGQE